MPIPPPTGPLWDAVAQIGGLEKVWPADSEDSARALGKSWQTVADQVGEGGFQASQAATGLDAAWQDGAGKAIVGKTNAYFQKVKDAALQISQIGIMGQFYADHLVAAKTAVGAEITKYAQAYAMAATPAPGSLPGAEQAIAAVVAEICKTIVDEEANAVKNTLAKQATDARNLHNKALISGPGNVTTAANAAMSVRKAQLEKQANELTNNVLKQGLPTNADDALRQNAEMNKGLKDGAEVREGAGKAASALKNAGRGLTGALAVGGIAYDIANGKPVAQAVTAGATSWAAATAAGAVVGSFVPVPVVGTLVGAGAGFVVGAFTSGAVNSLFENGPTDIGTAIDAGGKSVVDTGKAIGSLF
jgi:hypothetical protein